MFIWREDQVVRMAIFVDRYYVTDKLVKVFTGPNQDEEDFWGVQNPPPEQDWFKGWPTRPPSKILQDACNYSLSQRACTICKPIYTAENAPPTLPGIEQIKIGRYRCFQLNTATVSLEINSPHQTTRPLNRQAGKWGWRNINGWRTCKWRGKIHQLDDSFSHDFLNMWSQ